MNLENNEAKILLFFSPKSMGLHLKAGLGLSNSFVSVSTSFIYYS